MCFMICTRKERIVIIDLWALMLGNVSTTSWTRPNGWFHGDVPFEKE